MKPAVILSTAQPPYGRHPLLLLVILTYTDSHLYWRRLVKDEFGNLLSSAEKPRRVVVSKVGELDIETLLRFSVPNLSCLVLLVLLSTLIPLPWYVCFCVCRWGALRPPCLKIGSGFTFELTLELGRASAM